MFFEIILITAIVVLFYSMFYVQTRKSRQCLSKFDSIPTLPIFGNTLVFLDCRSPTEAFFKFRKIIKRLNYQPFVFWMVHRPLVVLSKCEDVQIAANILQKHPLFYKYLAEAIGNGIVTATPIHWKKSRTLVSPAFNAVVIANYYLDIFNKQNLKLMKKLRHEVGMGKTVDIGPYILGAGISSIHETIMGYDEDMDDNAYLKLHKTSSMIMELIGKRAIKIYLYPTFAFKIYLHLIGCPNIFEEFRDFYKQLILKKKKMFIDGADSSETDQERRPAIDVMLETNSFTDEELIDEGMTILFGGSDTTATTVSFTLLMLAQQQEIQEKVYQELYKVFGDSDQLPKATELSELTFLEQCIKETLRMYPVIPHISREATKDITLRDGRVIPAGTGVLMAIYEIHHSSDLFPDPESWNPDHFSPENVANRPANSFIPFSLGPRMCLGYKYSMMSMKASLSTFLRNFKISTSQTTTRINTSFFLKSEGGYNIELSERRNNFK